MRENLFRFIFKSTKVLLIFILFFIAKESDAAHLKGGYIEYEYISSTATTTTYKVTVYQYLDCGSTQSQRDQSVFLGIYNNATNQLIMPVAEVNLTNSSTVQKTNFECVQNPPQVCYFIDSYETIITIPNNSQGYQLFVQRCCRIGNIVNITNSSNTGANYFIEIPGTSGRLLQNSSPSFNMNDTVLLCANTSFDFKFDAIDKDGDSLSYAFTYGLNTPSTTPKPNIPSLPPFRSLPYNLGYDASNPFGSTIAINELNGQITGTAPSRSGDYVLAVLISEFRNGMKIGEARKEIHVTVSNCNIPEAVLPEASISCTTFSISLENQSSTSSNQSYYWDFGVDDTDDDISTSPTPTYLYKDTGTYIVKVVVNRGTVCTDSTTMVMKVYPGFHVGFESNDVCMNGTVQFKDTSHTTFGQTLNKTWVLDNQVQSSTNSILPVTYPIAGTYPVKLIVSDNLGCKDSVSKQIQVFALPVINLVSDTLICINDSIRFNISNSGTAIWSPVFNIINEKSLSPTVFPKRNQLYTVQLTDVNGCINNKSVQINTVSNLNLQVSNDRTACIGDEVELTASSFNGAGLIWEGISINNITTNSVKITAIEGVNTYYVNTYFGQNCNARESVTVSVPRYPVVNAGNDTTICYNTLATLAGTTNTPNYYWEQMDSPFSGSHSLYQTLRLTQSAVYILHAESNDICRMQKTDTVFVNVVPDVQIDAGTNTEIFLNLPYTIEATSNGNYQYRWTPSLGILKDTALRATINIHNDLIGAFGRSKLYVLTASTKEGCTATDNVTFTLNTTVKKLYIPTGFTPNGDGKNDVLKPIYLSTGTLLYFRVYNRYGQLVFETSAWNRGWDGNYKGNPSPSGAYIYDCQVREDTGNVLHQKGSFALIR